MYDIKGAEALIFDVDGTLADSMPAHKKAYELAFVLNGIPFNEKLFDDWAVFGGDILMKRIVIERGLGDENKVKKIIADKQKFFEATLDDYMIPKKGVIDTLIDSVLTYNMDIGIVTNGRLRSIEQLLKKLDVYKFATVLVTKEDVNRTKPYPDGYIIALNKLKKSPDKVIVFEDSDVGVAAAEGAGITRIEVIK